MILLVQQGRDAGRQMRLERGRILIGRGADCDLILQEELASRHHAELRRYGDEWLIVDLRSTNGTLVGNRRLQPDVPEPLPPGVPVMIGSARLLLQADPADAAPAAPAGLSEEELLEGEASAKAAPSAVWAVATWLSRSIVVVGCVLLVLGTLQPWVRVQVQLPLVGTVVDRTLGGQDSGQAWLLWGMSGIALLFLVLDVASHRFGLAAGLGQALLSLAAAAAVGVDAYRYYQVGTQKVMGISLLDIFSQYARKYVHVAVEPGVYLVAGGLAALILGGVLRMIVAGLEPSTR